MTEFKGVTTLRDPLTQHKLTELRDKNTQKHAFRQALHDIGIFLTIAMTRELSSYSHPIETPLTQTTGASLDFNKLAFISILRAGNGLLDGAISILPGVPCGFIGAERDSATLKARVYYEKLPPNIAHKSIFIFDPMLATGHTLKAIIELLKAKNAHSIYVGAALAAPEGLSTVLSTYPDIKIFTASIDEKLNEKGYILPGLGDAGDRLYGTE